MLLWTFTDGLDNVSLDDNETNPDNYPTKEAYLEGLCNKIRQGVVHDKDITAYTIGLRGNDVSDLDEFHANLKKLASKDSNAYEVSDMNQALQKFTEIAESLHSVTMTASLTLLIPPGYNDGQICRFTFDNISSSSAAAENSTSFIECTYKRTENGRRLENITYHGWQTGSSSVSSFEKVDRYYKVAFENLTKANGNLVSNDDKRYLQLFYKTSSGEWQKDSEFKPDTFSDVIEEQSSALIMLVLDCTTSLGSEFSSLKDAAKRFVETLVSSNNGGGGGNGQFYYDISISANPSNGGTVTGGGTYQQGNSCTVKATANSDYTFSNWTENGTQVSTNANYTFTVTGSRTLVANFSSNPQNYTISVSANPSGSGTVTGGGTFQQGYTCTVKATANSGYTFSKWTENGNQVSTNANYTFTVTGNRTLVANFTYNSIGGHAYVDLGLPSGTLWATCNVGALSPEEYGDYYAWGEITTKNVYSESTYTYSGNPTTLPASADAATANWGTSWRMPTKTEMEELFNGCEKIWTTINSTKGFLLTGPNGKSIFLPAAGGRTDITDWQYIFYEPGDYCRYWTSTLYPYTIKAVWSLWLNSSYGGMWGLYYDFEPYYGLSVRAVCTAR